MATIKDVAKAARVSAATVSAVINDSAYVSPSLRARVLEAIRSLDYSPSQLARNLRRGRNELIALVVADPANPFYAKVVWAAEAAVAAWGYSLGVFNSDEKPEAESASSPACARCNARACCWCRSATNWNPNVAAEMGGASRQYCSGAPSPTLRWTRSRSTTSRRAFRRRITFSTSGTRALAPSQG